MNRPRRRLGPRLPDVHPAPENPQLIRAIGRWSLTALMINAVIGSGIFGLPDDIARLLGPMAPLAYLGAALGMAVIAAAFAEVGSQFDANGGIYLYARETFGRFMGIQIGWSTWVVRLTSGAAIASIFVAYLGEFFPEATSPVGRIVMLTLLLGTLVTVNIRGVAHGTVVSNVFTVAKLLTLGAFAGAGLLLVKTGAAPATVQAGPTEWGQALLLLVFVYGGMETALMPMGEARNPRRDIPFAIFTALAVITTVYLSVHWVAMRALPDLASSTRPLADAARTFAGETGAVLVAAGALISTFGILSAQTIGTPRLTQALAARGDFPSFFGVIHSRYRTPHVSILLFGVLVLVLAVYGDFTWNAILAATARLFTYATACAALVRLRHTRPGAAAFRVPAGHAVAAAGMIFCVAIALQMTAVHAVIIGIVALVAAVNWLLVRGRAG